MKGYEELARSIIPVSSDLSGFSRGTDDTDFFAEQFGARSWAGVR